MTKDDLISRQELANLLVVAQDEDFITLEEYDKFWDLVSRVPSADRPKGKWIPYLPEGLRYKCSECESKYDTPWHFCPNCGSYNRGENHDKG